MITSTIYWLLIRFRNQQINWCGIFFGYLPVIRHIEWVAAVAAATTVAYRVVYTFLSFFFYFVSVIEGSLTFASELFIVLSDSRRHRHSVETNIHINWTRLFLVVTLQPKQTRITWLSQTQNNNSHNNNNKNHTERNQSVFVSVIWMLNFYF